MGERPYVSSQMAITRACVVPGRVRGVPAKVGAATRAA